jgi:hypothetical protein
MKIIDNCLPDKLFSNLIENVFREDFPWYYVSQTASPSLDITDTFDYSWTHLAIENGEDNSKIAKLVRDIHQFCMSRSGEKPGNLFRARFGLITALEKQKIHEPHIDFDFEHRVGLLYLNNSDGDTIFYKDRYQNLEISSETFKRQKGEFSIENSISPIANRFVLFEGDQFHSSSTPYLNQRRIVLNMDIVD